MSSSWGIMNISAQAEKFHCFELAESLSASCAINLSGEKAINRNKNFLCIFILPKQRYRNQQGSDRNHGNTHQPLHILQLTIRIKTRPQAMLHPIAPTSSLRICALPLVTIPMLQVKVSAMINPNKISAALSSGLSSDFDPVRTSIQKFEVMLDVQR